MCFDPLTMAIALGISSILLVGASFYSVFIFFRGIQLAPLIERKERLKEEIASCQSTLSDLESAVQGKQAEKANAERLIAQGESERQWLEEHHDEVASLRAQIANTKNALQAEMDKFHEVREELQKLQQQYQKTAGEHQQLGIENERFRQDTAEQKKTRELLQRTLQQLSEEKIKAVHENNLIQKELLQNQAELAELNRKIDSARTTLADLRQQQQSHQSQINALLDSQTKLRAQCHQEEEKLHGLISKRIDESPLNEAAKWQDLNRPVFQLNLQGAAWQTQSEEEWLEHLKTALKENGIRFHERMIHAFHTGLKVADYSPLVVLAGISGTGKSLLPRLYARAIGMNFLQIAVQPRWDNPQDMFGFYNYMEGRYKATELSRMLWEFDIYNNEEARKKYHSTLPMNLVLLDEMNLAKVEYYFSDMLSKLEVRRGLNPQNEESRRNAEIEIESGSPQKASEAKRLFVGRNTLFVGTMNEDESTQSLSDKVIDRSNVLRFGKPNDLAAQPDIRGFEAAFVPRLLDFKVWQTSWVKRESRTDSQACEIISAINNELAQIGRPFAYRVFSAILAYIHNYPHTVNAFSHAMADQIEMKVLPKLNGIDKESSSAVKQSLDRIGETIARLGDDELTEAFCKAKDNRDEIFFQWRGVSR